MELFPRIPLTQWVGGRMLLIVRQPTSQAKMRTASTHLLPDVAELGGDLRTHLRSVFVVVGADRVGAQARRPAKQQRDGLLLRLSPLARGSAILLRGVSPGGLGCVRVPGRASVPTRRRLRGRRYGLRLWGPSPDGRVPPQVDHRGLLPRCLLVQPGLAGQRGRLLFHERSLGRGPDESALCLALSSGRIRRRGQGQWVA
jgi:hypothetical protein